MSSLVKDHNKQRDRDPGWSTETRTSQKEKNGGKNDGGPSGPMTTGTRDTITKNHDTISSDK